MTDVSFTTYNTDLSWTVPSGVSYIKATLIGGAGGSSTYAPGGKGGYLQAEINVTAGEILYIYVGSKGTDSNNSETVDTNHLGGKNGYTGTAIGGTGGYDNSPQTANGAGGGGSSDIRIGGTGLSNRILVAGAGGGAGYQLNSSYAEDASGGNGGGTTGQEGYYLVSQGYGDGGGGGTQTAGGTVGPTDDEYNNYRGSYDGSFGFGGNATYSNAWGSGGGGGGYYGGAAGSSTANHNLGFSAGGGGGSSYFDSSRIKSGTTPINTQGYSGATGDGSITINYSLTIPYIISTTILSDNTKLITTFNKQVFDTSGGSGSLKVSDFLLSLNGGQATLTSSTPSNIDISGNSYTLGLPISGIANGTEVITVNPKVDSIFDSSGNAALSTQTNNTVTLNEKVLPYITGTTINSNNSAVDVTFNEAVYSTNSGSGQLQISDFKFSIANGVASLNDVTPISITQTNNTFNLGISLNGTPNGAEVLTVSPVANSIFDASGNIADVSQSNNTVNLNDKTSPTITGTTIASDNSSVTVTFSEAVFNTPNNTGSLEVGDFSISLPAGVVTLGSNTPKSISSSGNDYTLGLDISGTSNGSEQLTVSIFPNSIYDSKGNVASTTQSNNTVNLKDKIAPIITSTTVATDNQSITVTFSEPVFDTSGGSGALQVSDFSLNITSGDANLTSSTPTTISVSNNSYTLGLPISGTANGSESITVLPVLNSIFDAGGNAALTSQSNNTVTLNDKKPAIITSTTLNASNNLVTTTFNDQVSRSAVSNLPLLKSSFTLSISGGVATLSSSTPTTISNTNNSYTLGFGLIGTPNGSEQLTVNPVASSIYDLNGNVSITPQSNNTVTLNSPRITSVSLANDNSTISVTFNNSVFNTASGSGSLEANDFVFLIYGGTASLQSNTPTSISATGNVYTLGIPLKDTPNGDETLVVNPASITSIYSSGGVPALINQSNNSLKLFEKILPIITSTTINNANSLITVTFSEAVYSDYSSNTASGSLDVNDFVFSITGGTAALASNVPSSISSSGNIYTLGLNLSTASANIPNGSETLTVNPASNAIYDSKGNVASTNQNNNTVKLTEKIPPTITAISNITNSQISITFSEPVYSNSDGTGALQVSDFSLNLSGGVSTLNSTTPISISNTNNTYILGVSINGNSNGSEVLIVNPASSTSIYDKAGNAANISQSNNSINLKETSPPIINSTTLSSDNNTIIVTFSEAVYSNNNGSGNLEVSDFKLTITGGVAKLSYNYPYSISKSGNSYTLGLPLSNLADGTEILTVTPIENNIFDLAGNVASTTQNNNTVQLNHKLGPIISNTTLASDNLSVNFTFGETVYGDNNQQTNIDVSDIKLILINGQAKLSSNKPSSLSVSNNIYTIGIPLTGIPNGSELLTILPQTNSIFDSSGNVALTSNQTNNSVYLNEKIAPYIIGTTIRSDNLLLYLTFSELVYSDSSGTQNLTTSDFLFTLSNNGLATFANNTYTSNPNTILKSNNTYTLGVPLTTLSNGTETLTVTPVLNSIYDAKGNIANSTQSNNSVTLYKQNKPYILSTSINKENTIITILFSEAVYHFTNGTGNLQNNNFKFTLSGGQATLGSSIPTSLTQNNNYFNLGISINGIPNGNEIITVLPFDSTSIYDLKGNSAGTSQINNTVYLNEKIVPYITKTTMSENNDYMTVTFNEAVYFNNNATMDIIPVSFIIKSIPSSEDFVAHESPDKIEKDGNSYKLYFKTRKPVKYGGLYILLRNPVYDAAGNKSEDNQKNNTALFNTIRQFQPQELVQIKNNTSRLINRKRVIGNSTSGKTSSVNGFNSNASVNGGSK